MTDDSGREGKARGAAAKETNTTEQVRFFNTYDTHMIYIYMMKQR